jgi:hypothetical protein
VVAQDTLRVLKEGDSMTGDLTMGGSLVRGLPTEYPPMYAGDEATSWAQAMQLGFDLLKDVDEPTRPQNAATKGYVDGRTGRVFTIVRVGTGTQDHQTADLDAAGNHINLGAVFRHKFGVSKDAWDVSTGLYTAPADGVYFVAVNLRIQAPAGTGSLANVYTSVNGSTDYEMGTNIVYRVYEQMSNRSAWHSFEIAGLVALSKGDTLRLVCSCGSGMWTFHTTATMQIGRFSI